MIFYRFLLRLFPRPFRGRFADDMAALFADRLAAARAKGRAAIFALWWRTCGDLAAHGLAERRAERARTLSSRRQTMGSIRQDSQYALRALRQRPGFTTVAVLTLALGLGATSAVFSVTDTLLWRALPYPSPDRLVAVEETNARSGFGGNVAMPNFDDWRGRIGAFEAAAAWTMADVNLAGGQDAERTGSALVTTQFFDLTGARVIAGRTFRDDEREPGRDRVAVLSEGAWTRLFGGRRDIVGQNVTLDGVPHEIVGVVSVVPTMDNVAVWRPLARSGAATSRTNHAYRSVARLRPGLPAERARAELASVYGQLATAYPDTNRDWSAKVTPLQTTLTEDITSQISLMNAVVSVLLVITCANLASLLLARASDRRREFAVRAALGAGRGRLIRQVLTETVVLSAAGGIAGLALAVWFLQGLTAIVSRTVTLWTTPHLDWRVLLFSTALSIVTGLAFGILPAVLMTRRQPQTALRGGVTTTQSRGGRHLRTSLSFVQMALAAALLVCAGLLLSSFYRVMQVDPGFDVRNVLAFRVTPPRSTYAAAPALLEYQTTLIDRLRHQPAVAAVGGVSGLPMAGGNVMRGVIRVGEPIPEPGRVRLALFQSATPGYLPAMGMRLVRGRDFNADDTATSAPVALVNESLAKTLWPGGDAVGRELLVHTDEQAPRLVVGVFADVRQNGLDRQIGGHYIAPLPQSPVRTLNVALRLSSPLDIAEIRRVAAAIDPALPIYQARTLDDLRSGSLSQRRALTITLGVFGALAVIVAAIGLYGTLAANVGDRRREIGVRVALGATTSAVRGLVVRQSAWVACGGTIAGLLLSYWATPLFRQSLFQVTTLDPLTMAPVIGVLFAIAVIATWVPARRAMAVNPVDVLRQG